MWRLLALATVLGGDPPAKSVVVPVGDGSFLVTAQFFGPADTDDNIPKLTFMLRNRTAAAWPKIKLRLDVTTKCDWGVFTWKLFAQTDVGWNLTSEAKNRYFATPMELVTEVDRSCTAEVSDIKLVFAKNEATQIVGDVNTVADVDEFLREIEVSRQARKKQDAAIAEVESKAAAKKAAVGAARQKQLAAQSAKVRADQEERSSAERRRIRQLCGSLYGSTADRKVKDLTVREEQQVRACQGLGLYSPS